jgi:hypothetical protein
MVMPGAKKNVVALVIAETVKVVPEIDPVNDIVEAVPRVTPEAPEDAFWFMLKVNVLASTTVVTE